MKEVHNVIQQACKEKIERDRKRGIINRPVRAMIVGIPNVGKSTFINSFAGKACAKTGNRPGVTKGKQWIRLNKNVELLDTPGILWPKFDDQAVGLRLAFIGSIKDEIVTMDELALYACQWLMEHKKEAIENTYGISILSTPYETLCEIANKRGYISKGTIDENRLMHSFVREIRDNKLGAITWEII